MVNRVLVWGNGAGVAVGAGVGEQGGDGARGVVCDDGLDGDLVHGGNRRTCWFLGHRSRREPRRNRATYTLSRDSRLVGLAALSSRRFR